MQDSRQSWARLALALIIGAIGNAGMWVIVLFLPDVEASFGITRAEASLCYTLTMIGFALGNFALGGAVDRWGMQRTLIGGAAAVALGFAISAMAPNAVVLAGAQFVVGVGTAAAFGPLIADISQWFRRRRGIAVAIVASGNYFAGALWPWLLVPVAQAWDWRMACWVVAVVSLVTLVPLALMLSTRAPEPVASTSGTTRQTQMRLRPGVLVLLLCIAGVGCCVAMAMPQVHIVSLCVSLGFGQEVGARMLSLMLLAGVVSRLVFGVIADRLGGLRTLLISATMQGIALFLFLPFETQATLTVVAMVFGFSQGGIVPSYALIVREYLPAKDAGRYIGLVMCATIIGMALGGWMSGKIFDLTGSYALAVLNGIGWNALNVGVMLMIYIASRGRPRALAA